MGERNTKIRFSAQVSEYIDGVQRMASATREAGSEAEKLAQKREAFNLLGGTMLAAGGLLAAGLTIAVAKAADFNQAMSFVDAATHESAANMSLLRQAALDAGASTVFSATESANAIEELGKAGLSTADILGGGLTGSLDLAAAGGLGVAEAAGSMATALKQFGLEGRDSSHVADLLAAGAGKAMGDVSDLSQALSQAGLVANSTGLSIEETTGGLAAFASAGLLGSDSGTAFKSMLQRLTPQSAEAKTKMDELGISAYDANGQFIGLTAFAGNLHNALKDLTPEQRSAAQAIIFGSDAVRASNVLYEEGAAGIQKYIDQTNDAGYAAETAAIRLDNLKGDVEALGGSFDTALIQSGSGANDVLRTMTQGLTGLIDGYNALPAPLQAGITLAAAAAAGIALVGGAALVAVPKIAEYRAAMTAINLTGGKLAATLGKGGAVLAAIGVTTAGLSGLGQVATLTSEQISQLNAGLKLGDMDTLNAQFKAGQVNAAGLTAALTALQSDDFFENQGLNVGFGKFMAGLGIDAFYKDLRDSESAFRQLGTTIGETAKTDFASARDQFNELVDAAGGGAEAARRVMNALGPDFKSVLVDLAQQQGVTIDDTQALALMMDNTALSGKILAGQMSDTGDGINGVGEAATAAALSVDDYAKSLEDYGTQTMDLTQANSDLYQSIQDAADAWGEDGFAATLDLTTQAGRDNTDALFAIADAANTAAARTYETSLSQEDLVAKLDEGRNALYAQARQFFDTDQQAWDYVNTLMKTPEQVKTELQLNGVEQRKADLQTFFNEWQGRTITMDLFLETSGGDRALAASAARYTAQAQAYAAGQIPNANGGLYDYGITRAFNSGGIAEGMYAGGPAPLYKFAEKETGWEAFISGRPGMEERNRGIAYEALARLGGVRQPPQPVHTAPPTIINNYEQHFDMPALPNIDPREASTIMGREFARQAAR